MLHGLRSRLTYANLTATVAVFLALGGGAYALSGVPDRSGVYHACVATSGALRVVAKSSSCRKTKTVRRGKRRVRIPGESAIAWNQHGPQGFSGQNGTPGRDAASMLTGNTTSQFGALPPTGVQNVAPSGGSSPQAPGTSSVLQRSPSATIVARDLSVEVDTAPPANARLTFTLVTGGLGVGTPTALSCTVESGTTTCNNTGATATISPGTDLTLEAKNTGIANATATHARWGWRATTP
jgi:hypothetical protein